MQSKNKTPNLKRYVVRKYIMAKSINHALKKEPKSLVDDCWVDEDFKKEHPERLESAIGFMIEENEDDEIYAKRSLRFTK